MTGLYALGLYEATPGPSMAVGAAVRPSFSFPLNSTGPTVVMFVHPRCPCTRASVAELAKILGHHPKLSAHVMFFTPPEGGEAWRETALMDSVRAIEHVQVHDDVDGKAARQAGVSTSGTVLVMAPDGRVLFRGGITPGRGHQGDNDGAEAVTKVIAAGWGSGEGTIETPVYGCAIVPVESCGECQGDVR